MARKLIDEKVINTVYNSIDIHIKQLKDFDIRIPNEYEKGKIEKSIEYLEDALMLLKPPSDEIKALKRKAYIEFQKAKSDLEEYKRKPGAEAEVIKKMEKNLDVRLRLYKAYKEGK